jgi:AraC-like DNA-binding protein
LDDILVLQSDQRANAALTGALSPSYRVEAASDYSALENRLRRELPHACVLDIFDLPNRTPLSTLGRIRRRYPSVALIVASDFSGREMDLYQLGRLNVDGVIRLEDRNSNRSLLEVVDRAIASSLASRAVAATATDLPPLVRDAIRWAIEHAESRPQVSALAEALAMTPRVLLREMRTLGLVPPRALLLWGRLIRASQLLERRSQTVEGVAYRLGYSTGGALGKAFKRYVGHSPTHLRKKGGLARTLQVFQQHGLRSRPDNRGMQTETGKFG